MEDAAKATVELGIRVPEDLRIVTHCNRGSSIRVPLPVTRIVQNPEDYARRLVKLLTDLMAGRTPAAGSGDIPFVVEHMESHGVVEAAVAVATEA